MATKKRDAGATTPSKPIAARILRRSNDGGAVRVAIFAPKQDSRDPNNDWVCEFEITGLPKQMYSRAFGVDSMQAMVEAIRAIRHTLQPFSSELTWLSSVGGIGFPLIPAYDDPDFMALIEATIEAENIRRTMYLRTTVRSSKRKGKQ
jgi:hypothetical protein